MGVHSKAPSCGAWGSAQLHVHHMHVGEAGASRVVSLAGPVPAQTPNQLSSPEISHKHPDHTVEAQAGGSQGSSRHGVGVAGGKWAESTDRAFIQHSARPAAVRCRQGSLKPEAIRMCGHSNTEALEVKSQGQGALGSLQAPSGSWGAQQALTWRPPAASSLLMSSVPHRAPRATNTAWSHRCEASRSCCSVAWSASADGDPTWGR